MPRRNREFDHTSRRFADKGVPTVKLGLADLVNQRRWFTAVFNGIRAHRARAQGGAAGGYRVRGAGCG